MKPILRGLLAAALSALACAAPAADPPSTWDQIKAFGHDRKHDAVAAGRQLITETDRQIAAMTRQTQHASAEARAAHEAGLKELKAKKKLAQSELAKLQKAGAKGWDATKEGFGKAYDELHQAARKVAAAAKGS